MTIERLKEISNLTRKLDHLADTLIALKGNPQITIITEDEDCNEHVLEIKPDKGYDPVTVLTTQAEEEFWHTVSMLEGMWIEHPLPAKTKRI